MCTVHVQPLSTVQRPVRPCWEKTGGHVGPGVAPRDCDLVCLLRRTAAAAVTAAAAASRDAALDAAAATGTDEHLPPANWLC